MEVAIVTRSRNFIATPPGTTIHEQLVDRGMNQKEFAIRMEMSEKHISKLINGDVHLTPDVAMRLEMVLGVPASFWNNLEALYREKIAKIEAENAMDEDIEISKKLPVKSMIENGWIENNTTTTDRILELRKFFEVVRLGLLKENILPGIACRRQAVTEKADYALIAWAQKAKLEARNIETSQINLKSLQNNLNSIRNMTILNPDEFSSRLVYMLSKCGIALVFLPHIGGSFLHGATFYDKNKIVIGLTVRGRDADRFWFSLFHELAHILLGHINNPFGIDDSDETAADEFARNILIPKEEFERFVSQNSFSRSSVIGFSQAICIDPGIIVGRLQKEGYIQYNWLNNLKTQYAISRGN